MTGPRYSWRGGAGPAAVLGARCPVVALDMERWDEMFAELQRVQRDNWRQTVMVSAQPAPRNTTAADQSSYPSQWLRASDRASEEPRESGAGTAYPAHWDTSPIDLNDGASHAERPHTVTGTAGSGAGIDYPPNGSAEERHHGQRVHPPVPPGR